MRLFVVATCKCMFCSLKPRVSWWAHKWSHPSSVVYNVLACQIFASSPDLPPQGQAACCLSTGVPPTRSSNSTSNIYPVFSPSKLLSLRILNFSWRDHHVLHNPSCKSNCDSATSLLPLFFYIHKSPGPTNSVPKHFSETSPPLHSSSCYQGEALPLLSQSVPTNPTASSTSSMLSVLLWNTDLFVSFPCSELLNVPQPLFVWWSSNPYQGFWASRIWLLLTTLDPALTTSPAMSCYIPGTPICGQFL